MDPLTALTDAALLRHPDPEAFGVFYRRHLPWVVGWLRARTPSRETAADCAAEGFAAALVARGRYDERIGPGALAADHRTQRPGGQRPPRPGAGPRPAPPGLQHPDLHRRGPRARRRLADDALAASAALDALPPDQARAVRGRVLLERSYEEIARELSCSPSVVRQRVSRGLRALRTTLEEPS